MCLSGGELKENRTSFLTVVLAKRDKEDRKSALRYLYLIINQIQNRNFKNKVHHETTSVQAVSIDGVFLVFVFFGVVIQFDEHDTIPW